MSSSEARAAKCELRTKLIRKSCESVLSNRPKFIRKLLGVSFGTHLVEDLAELLGAIRSSSNKAGSRFLFGKIRIRKRCKCAWQFSVFFGTAFLRSLVSIRGAACGSVSEHAIGELEVFLIQVLGTLHPMQVGQDNLNDVFLGSLVGVELVEEIGVKEVSERIGKAQNNEISNVSSLEQKRDLGDVSVQLLI